MKRAYKAHLCKITSNKGHTSICKYEIDDNGLMKFNSIILYVILITVCIPSFITLMAIKSSWLYQESTINWNECKYNIDINMNTSNMYRILKQRIGARFFLAFIDNRLFWKLPNHVAYFSAKIGNQSTSFELIHHSMKCEYLMHVFKHSS